MVEYHLGGPASNGAQLFQPTVTVTVQLIYKLENGPIPTQNGLIQHIFESLIKNRLGVGAFFLRLI